MIIDKTDKIAILNELVENGIVTDTSSYNDIISNDEIDTVTELIESLVNIGIITNPSHLVNVAKEVVDDKVEDVPAAEEVKVNDAEETVNAVEEVKVEEEETVKTKTTSTKKTTKKKTK
jgi:hypothetical protein